MKSYTLTLSQVEWDVALRSSDILPSHVPFNGRPRPFGLRRAKRSGPEDQYMNGTGSPSNFVNIFHAQRPGLACHKPVEGRRLVPRLD